MRQIYAQSVGLKVRDGASTLPSVELKRRKGLASIADDDQDRVGVTRRGSDLDHFCWRHEIERAGESRGRSERDAAAAVGGAGARKHIGPRHRFGRGIRARGAFILDSVHRRRRHRAIEAEESGEVAVAADRGSKGSLDKRSLLRDELSGEAGGMRLRIKLAENRSAVELANDERVLRVNHI